MCKWGTDRIAEVTIPAELSYTGKERKKLVGIDSCIYEIVVALNSGGVVTTFSCCGHGKLPGRIMLADGRELVIMPDRETTDKFFEEYGIDIHGEPIKRKEPQ